MTLSPFDLVLCIVILVSALIGVMRGLLKEVLSLATWVAAVILSFLFAPRLAVQLPLEPADTVGLFVAFLIIFLVVLIAGGLLQSLVGKLVTTTGLSGTDRLLGFLFGGARGAVVCIVALIMLKPFAEKAQWWEASQLREELMTFEEDVLDLYGSARQSVLQLIEQSR